MFIIKIIIHNNGFFIFTSSIFYSFLFFKTEFNKITYEIVLLLANSINNQKTNNPLFQIGFFYSHLLKYYITTAK